MSALTPATVADAGLLLFQEWVGAHYARSTSIKSVENSEGIVRATLAIGRRHRLGVTIVDTISSQASPEFDRARAIVENRLNQDELSVVLWVPRGAPIPVAEPGLTDLVVSVREALELEDGRREARFPITLNFRRTSTEGSVVTVLGGLSAHWARFTSRVPGTFQLNSNNLYRLPHSTDDRDALFERIIHEAGQPLIDDSITIPTEDAWTVNYLPRGASYVLGAPDPETDATGSHLRRLVRKLLGGLPPRTGDDVDARALVLLGLSTYAQDEKLSWLIRGLDPSLYSGHDVVAVIADGTVKTLLEPSRGALPWDAPLS